MLFVSRIKSLVSALLLPEVAGTLVAQTPLWSARYNDVAIASDRVTAVAFREDGAYLAGYNDAGWTAWKLAQDGTVRWGWRSAGLPVEQYSDQQPFIAGFDDAGNACLVAGTSYGQAVAWVAGDGHTVAVHQLDLGAAILGAVAMPDGSVICTGGRSDVVTFRLNLAGEIEWSARYNSPENGDDIGTAIALNSAGDVYVAGSAGSYTRNVGYAGLVLRYRSDGTLVWDRLVELDVGEPREAIRSCGLAVDSAGNAYVVGLRSAPGQTSQSIVYKVAQDGALLWHDDTLGVPRTAKVPGNPIVLLDEPRGAVYFCGDVRIDDTNSDFRVRRYDFDGVIQWTASYDGPAQHLDYVADAGLDGRGDLYLMGTSRATADNPDLVVARFDPSGQLLNLGRSDNAPASYDWTRVGGVDPRGEAIVIGADPQNQFDARAVSFDSDGDQQWSILLGTTIGSEDSLNTAAADESGAVYVAGNSNRRDGTEPAVLLRYRPDGSLEWLRRLPSDFRNPGAVAIDPDGGAIVVADAMAPPGMGLIKYTPDGAQVWTRSFVGPNQRSFLRRRMAMDAQGNLSICGSIEIVRWGADSDFDGIVTCIDTEGNLRWSRRLDGSRQDTLDAIAVAPSGAITVAGSSSQYYHNVPRDIVTARYSSGGQLIWERQFSDSNSMDGDRPVSVSVAPDGMTFVACRIGRWTQTRSARLLCYSDSGELLWARDYQSDGDITTPVETQVHPNGDLIVLYAVIASDDCYDIVVQAYGNDGGVHWERRLPGPVNHSEYARMLEIAANGDILISADAFPGPSYLFYDSMLARLDSAGNLRWTSRQPNPRDLSGWMTYLSPLPDGGFVHGGSIWSPETRSDSILVRYAAPPPDCADSPRCAGDLNLDCRVDFADLQTLLTRFGDGDALGFAPSNGDLDFDGDVDLQDLALLLSHWGEDCR